MTSSALRPARRPWKRRESRGHGLPPTLRVGALLVGLYVLLALVGMVWTPYDPLVTTSTAPYAHPSSHYLLGTDVLGRDVLSRLMYGAREVLLLSLLSTAVSTVLGAAIGLVSGYVGGLLDNVLMRLFEILISVPFLMLALLIIAAIGPSSTGTGVVLFGVIVLIYAPRTARVARSVALDLVTRDFVTASRARGESTWSIVRRDLLPNASGPLLVEFGVRAGYAPVLIGSLGFLGFGVHPPAPDWGLMINENRAAIDTAPFSVLAPAAALAGLVIGLNLLTDGLARKLGRTVEYTA